MIENAKDLAALNLSNGALQSPAAPGRHRKSPSLQPEPQIGAWIIPAPAPEHGTYSQREVATLCAVALATVRNWISRGINVPGHVAAVRLRTLRRPKGRILPSALCEFLSSVNEITVTVAQPDVPVEASAHDNSPSQA